MPPPGPPKKPDPSAAKKERNEYIPSFISQKPFYVVDDAATPSASDYLEHQRLQASEKEPPSKQQWYDRGKKVGPAATKFRKGACENCGAMTHKTRDCLSRKRKVGARFTGKDIQADEIVQDVKLGWDAKRDRWNGFEDDGVRHQVAPGSDDEEDKIDEETDTKHQKGAGSRNLRIREDTAKYLIDLDPESARYDPKTRSMVDTGATHDKTAALLAEEGFVKKSGDAAEFAAAQRAAWESQERGGANQLHLQANPTSAALQQKKEAEESKKRSDEQKQKLVDMYGDQSTFKRDEDTAPAVVSNERYVEYDAKGKVKGAAPTKTKCTYAEDVMVNNHTSVWGSWWRDFKWGYSCCHQTVKNSYCTGEEGRRALDDEERRQAGEIDDENQEIEEVTRETAQEEEAAHEKHVPNAVEDDAIAKKDSKARKRTRDELESGISEEQMEEYQRRKMSKDDPMAAYLGKDELVN